VSPCRELYVLGDDGDDGDWGNRCGMSQEVKGKPAHFKMHVASWMQASVFGIFGENA
jgi:hypothetical protein